MVSGKKRVELGGCLHEIRRHANTVGTRTDTVGPGLLRASSMTPCEPSRDF
jgi:hypothetical protein